MKKTFCFGLFFLIVFSFIGCSNNTNNKKEYDVFSPNEATEIIDTKTFPEERTQDSEAFNGEDLKESQREIHEYYNNEYYYNIDYKFKFKFPENWKNKVLVKSKKRHGIVRINFYYTGYKSPFVTYPYQHFFSINIIEKSYIDKHEDFNPEESTIIEKNDDYTLIIWKDLGVLVDGAEAIKEYKELQLSNEEIISRVEVFK